MILRGLRFPPGVSRGLMRVAGLVLLAQGALAWALLLGLYDPGPDGGTGFAGLAAPLRTLLVINAVLCPVAALGAWFVSEWGPVLWWTVILVLAIALGFAVPPATLIALLLGMHVLLALLWLVTAARTERREPEPRDDEPQFASTEIPVPPARAPGGQG